MNYYDPENTSWLASKIRALKNRAANQNPSSQNALSNYVYPAIDPMQLINPYYTRQQPYDSLAPMRMLQQYRSGQPMNQPGNVFQPYTPPQQSPVVESLLQPGITETERPIGGK